VQVRIDPSVSFIQPVFMETLITPTGLGRTTDLLMGVSPEIIG
jgi:hypothetical protein